jgi:hypothetical protein
MYRICYVGLPKGEGETERANSIPDIDHPAQVGFSYSTPVNGYEDPSTYGNHQFLPIDFC